MTYLFQFSLPMTLKICCPASVCTYEFYKECILSNYNCNASYCLVLSSFLSCLLVARLSSYELSPLAFRNTPSSYFLRHLLPPTVQHAYGLRPYRLHTYVLPHPRTTKTLYPTPV